MCHQGKHAFQWLCQCALSRLWQQHFCAGPMPWLRSLCHLCRSAEGKPFGALKFFDLPSRALQASERQNYLCDQGRIEELPSVSSMMTGFVKCQIVLLPTSDKHTSPSYRRKMYRDTGKRLVVILTGGFVHDSRLTWSPASENATEVTWYCSVIVTTDRLWRRSQTCRIKLPLGSCKAKYNRSRVQARGRCKRSQEKCLTRESCSLSYEVFNSRPWWVADTLGESDRDPQKCWRNTGPDDSLNILRVVVIPCLWIARYFLRQHRCQIKCLAERTSFRMQDREWSMGD